jgi:hypothetical protein
MNSRSGLKGLRSRAPGQVTSILLVLLEALALSFPPGFVVCDAVRFEQCIAFLCAQGDARCKRLSACFTVWITAVVVLAARMDLL